MWWIYQFLAALALLVAGPWLLLLRHRHYLPTMRGRFGGDSAIDETAAAGAGEPSRAAAPRLSGPPRAAGLWIHGVSVGETVLAGNLAGRLPADLPLLFTTITPTGQAQARSNARRLGSRAAVAYLPFELGFAIRRFFRRFAPAALVLVEGDFWPLLLRAVRRRGMPIAVVNGRVSDRSFPRLLAIRRLVQPLFFASVDRFGVQTPVDAERLRALGVPAERITVTGNLKFDAPEPPELPELTARLERLAAGRPILVAGSTMEGEEAEVLAAFERIAGSGDAPGGTSRDRALLVLAPRHPERFAAVAELVAQVDPGFVRRSGEDRPRPAIFLLDSIGELASTYRLATAAFVGGTLRPTGGHNPLEAARCGVPVAVGPSMTNFREIADLFDRSGAWARVDSGSALGDLWRTWLSDHPAAEAIGERGRALVAANAGAIDRTLALLAPLIQHARASASTVESAAAASR
ncbi:MAG: 3-deoxy-D-manno-octulosonic acid transferase [Thermoanaerobaculia bacterium]